MNQFPVRVVENKEVAPNIYLTWLETSRADFSPQPGQFVMVHCGENTLLRRPLCIHQLDDKSGRFALLYAKLGKGTKWLSQRGMSDKIDILGPLGNGFAFLPTAKSLTLVAGGMGIAPLHFLSSEAQKRGYQITLLIGVQKAKQLLEHTLKLPVKHVIATEDGGYGNHGMITDYLAKYINSSSQVFACGPVQMYLTLANMPMIKDKPTQISLEARMGCGTGVCYGCTVRTKTGLKQVCKDGPVFNLDDIIWDDLSGNCQVEE